MGKAVVSTASNAADRAAIGQSESTSVCQPSQLDCRSSVGKDAHSKQVQSKAERVQKSKNDKGQKARPDKPKSVASVS